MQNKQTVHRKDLESLVIANLADLGSVPDSKYWIVALSGGADSTALLHLLHGLAPHCGAHLSCVIVNHNLRKEAGEEAQLVARRARSFGIDCAIVRVEETPPAHGRQEWARQKRYDLLCAFARQKGGILWFGHHLDDQNETVAMRLSHGSGLSGLAGMKPLSYRQFVPILRPFLTIGKEHLREFCQTNALVVTEDPSNENRSFERVRWRKHLAKDNTLSRQLSSLSQAADAITKTLDATLSDFWEEAVFSDSTGLSLYFDYERFISLPHQAQKRVMRQMVSLIGVPAYPPAYEAITRLLTRLEQGQTATINGCIVARKGPKCLINPEAGRPHAPIMVRSGTDVIYRGRLLLRSNCDLVIYPMKEAFYGALAKDNSYREALSALSSDIRMIFPYAIALDDRPITPHIKGIIHPGYFSHMDWPSEQLAIYLVGKIANKGM